MIEPDWTDIKCRMTALTLKELRPVKSWYVGSLGGASGKKHVVDEMVSQMRHWWRNCADFGGRERVKNVLKELEQAEVHAGKDGA